MNPPLFGARGQRIRIGMAGMRDVPSGWGSPPKGWTGMPGMRRPKPTTPSGYYPGRKRQGVFVGTREEAAAMNKELSKAQDLAMKGRQASTSRRLFR